MLIPVIAVVSIHLSDDLSFNYSCLSQLLIKMLSKISVILLGRKAHTNPSTRETEASGVL